MSTWVMAWAVLACLVLYRHWRTGWGVGLLLTYIFSFGVLHWFVPLLRLLPWTEPFGAEYTSQGLRLSTYALGGFFVGLEFLGPSARRTPRPHRDDRIDAAPSPRLVTFYLVAGVLLYMLAPTAGRLPSVAALVSTGGTLAAAGVALKCWNAWTAGQRQRMWFWLSVTAIFPLITVMAQGFLGYGFVAVIIVLAFVASLHRPSWKMVAVGLVLMYSGLSVYVTYMRDRGEIREVVWGGEGYERRVTQLLDTFRTIEFFDATNERHLNRVDERLNQNYLIGASMAYLDEGWVPFARGGTLVDAAIAIVPRALWPDKPVVAGSGDTVTTYTGIRFAYGTSVGVGQVMELYINFGTFGVVLGFIVVGAIVAFVDRRAAWHLEQGDVRRFALWYLPGLSVLQIGGTLGELTATAAASYLVVRIAGTFTRDIVEKDLEGAEPIASETEAVP